MTSIFWRSTAQPPKTRLNFKPNIRVIFGVPKKKCYYFFWGPFSLKSKQLGYQLGSGINGGDRFLGLQMSGEVVAFSNLCFTVAGTDSTTPPLVLSETCTLALDSYQIHTPFHHPKKVTSRITQRIYTVQMLFQGGIFYVGFRGRRCSFSVFPFFQQEVPRILEKLLHPRRCWCPVTIHCWDVAHWWRYIAPLCNTWRVTWWPEILRKKALETNPNGAAVCFCLVNHGY